jgi:hypothetical protein
MLIELVKQKAGEKKEVTASLISMPFLAQTAWTKFYQKYKQAKKDLIATLRANSLFSSF